MIPETIPTFRRRYPHVKIQLYEELTYNAIERNILDGRAFLGVANYFSKAPNITSVVLGEEELLLTAYADHPVVKRLGVEPGDPPRLVDIGEFKDTPLIVPKDTRTAEIAQTVLQKQNPDQPVFLETRNIENSLRLCSEGLGMTFLCDSHIHFKYLPKNLVFFSTAAPEAKMLLYLLYRSNAYIPSYIQAYIDMLRDYAKGRL